MFGLVSTLLLVGFVVAPKPDPKFSHDLALNMLHLAAAAYSDDPGVCINNHFDGKVVRFYKVDCKGPLAFSVPVSCAAYTALLRDKQAIVLSFRGTDGFMQLFKEGAHSSLTKDWFGDEQVNSYFLSAFRELWNTTAAGAGRSMLEDARSLIRTHKDYKIWITGHSLGGAMASLAASYLLETEAVSKKRTYLVTFGQPRTGDKVFADTLNAKIRYAFRVINTNDMVPHIPSTSGILWKVKYLHHKKEIFYLHPSMESGGFTESCPNEDEPNYEFLAFCSGHYESKDLDWWFPFKNHKCYYGKYVSVWGIEGCVATKNYTRNDICK